MSSPLPNASNLKPGEPKHHASPLQSAISPPPPSSSAMGTPLTPATPSHATTPLSSVASARGKGVRLSLEEQKLPKKNHQEHVGQLVQLLVSHMQANRQEFSEEELVKVLEEEKKKFNEKTRGEIFKKLKESSKVKFSSLARGGKGTYSYHSTFSAKNIADIRAQLGQYPQYAISGVEVSVLNDSYQNAKEDVAKMIQNGNEVLVVYNESSKTNVLYPNNLHIKVDKHIKDLWHSVNVTQEVLARVEKSDFPTFEWEADKRKRALEEKKEQGKTKRQRTKKSIRAPKSNEHVQGIDFSVPFKKE